jgi:hypothetical protein
MGLCVLACLSWAGYAWATNLLLFSLWSLVVMAVGVISCVSHEEFTLKAPRKHAGIRLFKYLTLLITIAQGCFVTGAAFLVILVLLHVKQQTGERLLREQGVY